MATNQIWSFAVVGHADDIAKFRATLEEIEGDDAQYFRASVLEEQANYVWYGELHWASYYSEGWNRLLRDIYEVIDEIGDEKLTYSYTHYTDVDDRNGLDDSSNGDVYSNHEIRILRPDNLPPRQHDLIVSPGCHILSLIPTEFTWDGKIDYGLRAFDYMDCIGTYIEGFPQYISDPKEVFRLFINESLESKDVRRIMKNVAYPYPDGYYIIRVGFKTLDPKIADLMIMSWKDGRLPIKRRTRGKGTREETPAGEEAATPPTETGGQD